MQGADPSHQGFAAAYIALQQTVHGYFTVQVFPYFLQAGYLVGCQAEGEAFNALQFELGRNAWSCFGTALYKALVPACDQLQVEEFGEGKGPAGFLQHLDRGRKVIGPDGLIGGHEVVTVAHRSRQFIFKGIDACQNRLDIRPDQALAQRAA